MQRGRPTRFYSNAQEKKIAKAVGGKQVANSGATTFNKGDITTNKFLIEAKTVTKEQKTFTVKREWIEKNQEEAFAMGKMFSAVAIDFGDGEQFYIISQKLFNRLVEALDND